MKQVFYAIIFVLLWSCKSDPDLKTIPQSIISPDSMVQIMAEMHYIEAAIKQHQKDTVTPEMAYRGYQNVFNKYNIPAARFYNSYNYYVAQPDTFEAMYEEVLNTMSRLESEYLPPGKKKQIE